MELTMNIILIFASVVLALLVLFVAIFAIYLLVNEMVKETRIKKHKKQREFLGNLTGKEFDLYYLSLKPKKEQLKILKELKKEMKWNY